ncbi:hypothetical protein MGYG_09173 [Nannizzia gypsea CBS 118893]|uniref:Uncharacterized protein n=1 Tax=Arthroderma gypseum (strain ATCC MYA-4604 / CBS 118893) TaxID=535722 RepID=E4V4B3_ARTGP|nr:hypothetical protein MGYG_09173 [Nannizzia gypsea CBS 118893]EFR04837.1 hypothetical protein MGYG_09173 [Nannizzia gypsea CBS 118893]
MGTLTCDLPSSEANKAARKNQTQYKISKADKKGSQNNLARRADAPVYIRALKAIKKRDAFTMRNIHTFNIELAIYFARNRILMWAEGHPIRAPPPESENLDQLMAFPLCRNDIPSTGPIGDALKILRGRPKPSLFPV